MNILYPDFYHSLDDLITRQAQGIIHIIFISSHNLGCVNSVVGAVFCVLCCGQNFVNIESDLLKSDLQSLNALVK